MAFEISGKDVLNHQKTESFEFCSLKSAQEVVENWFFHEEGPRLSRMVVL